MLNTECSLLGQTEKLCVHSTSFSMVCVTRSLDLCVCLVDRCLYISHVSLAIVLSVLRFTDSDYPFGIFKLFLHKASPWQRFDPDNAVTQACDLFEGISYTREPYSYNSLSNNPITVKPGLRSHLKGKVKDMIF